MVQSVQVGFSFWFESTFLIEHYHFLFFSVLRWATSSVLSRADCEAGTGLRFDGLLCLRGTGGICGGDSGSPAVVERTSGNYELVGIANYIVGSCAGGSPDVFASAAYFDDWIDDIISNH